jgi:hypothetical protein
MFSVVNPFKRRELTIAIKRGYSSFFLAKDFHMEGETKWRTSGQWMKRWIEIIIVNNRNKIVIAVITDKPQNKNLCIPVTLPINFPPITTQLDSIGTEYSLHDKRRKCRFMNHIPIPKNTWAEITISYYYKDFPFLGPVYHKRFPYGGKKEAKYIILNE